MGEPGTGASSRRPSGARSNRLAYLHHNDFRGAMMTDEGSSRRGEGGPTLDDANPIELGHGHELSIAALDSGRAEHPIDVVYDG